MAGGRPGEAGCGWSPGLGIVETKPQGNTFSITVLRVMETHG